MGVSPAERELHHTFDDDVEKLLLLAPADHNVPGVEVDLLAGRPEKADRGRAEKHGFARAQSDISLGTGRRGFWR